VTHDRVASESPSNDSNDYQARLGAETWIYRDCLNVHDLPEIFHYWSNKYVRPQLEAFGFSTPGELFRNCLEEHCERRTGSAPRFLSIGSGNCDLEIEMASILCAKRHTDFVIDCLDLNPAMLERGCSSAASNGVGGRIQFIQGDVNEWEPAHEYDAVIANQSLHHVLKLERLFEGIRKALKPGGRFVISDMIGRNGHQLWPEALSIAHEFWRKLPPSYRFNRQLNRYEELYKNHDCSNESFEGIRAQDILPLLLERFHFHFFMGFANVIDPFVGRSFGHGFDPARQWDRDFINAVHVRDEKEINLGRIKPTHMLAIVAGEPGMPMISREPLSPQFCVRAPAAGAPELPYIGNPNSYDWGAWPHSAQSELKVACQRLADAENRIEQLHSELEKRAAWVRKTEQEFEERTAYARMLEKESEQLNSELEKRAAWVRKTEQEFEERTAYARRLEKELVERNSWAMLLSRGKPRRLLRKLYNLIRR